VPFIFPEQEQKTNPIHSFGRRKMMGKGCPPHNILVGDMEGEKY